MAILKYTPEKDSCVYSFNPLQNAGLDEIMPLILSNGKLNYDTGISRILIEFDNNEILSKYNQITSSKDLNLKLFVANGIELPSEYTLDIFNINDSWKNGYGREHNTPITSDGVSWGYRNGNDRWTEYTSSNYANYSPNSFSSSYWIKNLSSSVSFDIYTNKDVDVSVKDLFLQQISQSYQGGYLIKFTSSLEQDANANSVLNFYSKDTHTIYSPLLELKWDDSIYLVTGSLISFDNYKISLSNNRNEFTSRSIARINVLARDEFPQRVFSTGSLFLSKKYLPITSYYAVKDLKIDKYIIDFDDNYTKISRDENGNYFNLYFQNFEQNRYYQIEIKSIIDDIEIYHLDPYIFKVIA